MLAAGSRGQGAQYEKQRKAKAKVAEAKEEKLKKAEKWTVTVTVKSAVIYQSTDSNGLSDPYAEVFVGDDNSWKRIGTTKVQSKTLSPVWDETFTATVDGLHDEVKVKFFDKDTFGSDYIGTWKALGHGTNNGVDLPFHPKGNHKLITAVGTISVSWFKKS